jgi:hypothetical protein
MGIPHFLLTPDILSKVEGSLVTVLVGGGYKVVHDLILNRRLQKIVKADKYTLKDTKNRIVSDRGPYVRPDCQKNNPADAGESLSRESLFQEVDHLLGPPLNARLIFLLGDTGIGKSTFLDKYYAYIWRSPRRSRRFKPVVKTLRNLNVASIIKDIDEQNRSEIVLLLDALDEDPLAVADFAARLGEIIELANRFRAVVVTSRSQFLDASTLPHEISAPAPSGPMSLTTGSHRDVAVLYLSPFSDKQIKKYLNSRFKLWQHPLLRIRAKRAANRFQDLISRPLLLSHIEDLAASAQEPKFACQTYEIILDAWLRREEKKEKLTSSRESLMTFSEGLALELFSSGRDRIPRAELQQRAEAFGLDLFPREVQDRSLLHNDADGNWKFAHRSILEYLVVRAATDSAKLARISPRQWTDQMQSFAYELLTSGTCARIIGADLSNTNFEDRDLSGVSLRNCNLKEANFVNCNLREADFTDSDLSQARLSRASVSGLKIENCNLNGTQLSGVDLTASSGLTLQQAALSENNNATAWPNLFLNTEINEVFTLGVSGNGLQAAVASSDYCIQLWNLRSRKKGRLLDGHSAFINGLSLNESGSLLLSASSDGSVRLWDLAEGGAARTFWGHSSQVLCVAFNSDGDRAISAGLDNKIKVWDVKSGKEFSSFDVVCGNAKSIAFHNDDRDAIYLSGDGILRVTDLKYGRELRSFRAAPEGIGCVSLSSDGGTMAVGAYDGSIVIQVIDNDHAPLRLRTPEEPIIGVALNAHGTTLVSVAEDKNFRLWFPVFAVPTAPFEGLLASESRRLNRS